jgi:hypothetical protein
VKRWCPRCEQGWIQHYVKDATGENVYSCDECEAAWADPSRIGGTDTSRYLEGLHHRLSLVRDFEQADGRQSAVTLDYYTPDRSPRRPDPRRYPVLVCIGVIHLLCAAAFSLTPPMGQMRIPWDYIHPISVLLTFIICPLGYVLAAILFRSKSNNPT